MIDIGKVIQAIGREPGKGRVGLEKGGQIRMGSGTWALLDPVPVPSCTQ